MTSPRVARRTVREEEQRRVRAHLDEGGGVVLALCPAPPSLQPMAAENASAALVRAHPEALGNLLVARSTRE